ncbi:MAG: glycosyltransferase family 39 protein [Elusimicrobia bacterium]|nr:glycosyltransferase family 39 protein [Candidatus Liberimonas magnetica]
MTTTNPFNWYLLLVIALFLFLSSTLKRASQTPGQDELPLLVAADNLYTKGAPISYINPNLLEIANPHFNLRSIYYSFKLFGKNIVSARLSSIVFAFVGVILIFFVVLSYSKNELHNYFLQWASIVTLIYASTPAVLQGALLLQMDTTTLIPSVILYLFAISKNMNNKSFMWSVLLIIFTAIALWAKLITSVVVIAFSLSFILFYMLSAGQGQGNDIEENKIQDKSKAFSFLFSSNLLTAVRILLAISLGVLLFLISWYIYCKSTNVTFSGPFKYFFLSFSSNSKQMSSWDIFQNVSQLFMWIGVFPLILFSAVLINKLSDSLKTKSLNKEDIFIFCGTALFIGYSFIGGSNFGYPKYLIPAISLIYIHIGIELSKNSCDITKFGIKNYLTIAVFSFLITFFIVGDPLYTARYLLKESIVFGVPEKFSLLKNIAVRLTLFCAACFMFYLFYLKNIILRSNLIIILLILSLGSNLAMSLKQTIAKYHTGFNYGCIGTAEASEYIRANTSDNKIVIVPNEIGYYLQSNHPGYSNNDVWSNKNNLVTLLSDAATQGIAYSIPTNTVYQIKTILFDPDIQKIIKNNYSVKKIGTYYIWLRTNKGST